VVEEGGEGLMSCRTLALKMKMKREVEFVAAWTVFSTICGLFIGYVNWWAGILFLGVIELILLGFLRMALDAYLQNVVTKGDKEDEERKVDPRHEDEDSAAPDPTRFR
jgi:hypothetical protein